MYQSNHPLLHYLNDEIFKMLGADAADKIKTGEHGEHTRQRNANTARQGIQLSIQSIQWTGVNFS